MEIIQITLIRSNLKEHFEGTAQTHRSAASPGNAAVSSSTDTTPPESAAVDDGPVLAPAVTGDTSDLLDALSALAASAVKPRTKPGPKAKPKAKARPCIPLDTPVWLKLPNVPASESASTPGRDELVDVCAMLRGPAGRDIWLDIGSLHRVIAFAADELYRCGSIGGSIVNT